MRNQSNPGRVLGGALTALLLAIFGMAIVEAPAANAVGTYSNAAIADKALTYWNGSNTNRAPGSKACEDAQKPGDSGGQCRAFVNCIIWMVSNHTQNTGGSDYFTSFTNAGGVEIISTDALAKGDIIQVGQGTHTLIIVSKVSAGQYMVVDSNHWEDETVGYYQRAVSLNATTRAFRMGTVSGSSGTGTSTNSSRMLVTRSDSVTFGNDSLMSPSWTQLTSGALSVRVAGTRMVIVTSCGSAVTNDSLTSPNWVQLTPCGGAKAAAISSSGRIMLITGCDAATANDNPLTNPNWTQLMGCGQASAIAAGGNIMLLKRSDGVLFGNNSLTSPNWVQLTSNPFAFSVGSNGRVGLVTSCGSAVANDNPLTNPNWTQLMGCGQASSIAVGTSIFFVTRHDGVTFGNNSLTSPNWVQMGGGFKSIAIGSGDRTLLLTSCNAAMANDSALSNPSWTQLLGCGEAAAVAVG